jgi:organic hydroperoxide reductase OsmC/OhrA
MTPRRLHYHVRVIWTGNQGTGTRDYRSYSRAHEIRVPGRPVIQGSADPAFRGDESAHSPEDLLVAALSACHMLWYLHLCADAGIVVQAYDDGATGRMAVSGDGGGRFEEVTLHPVVTVAPGADLEEALRLHTDAHRHCFIANSVNFPVRLDPRTEVEEAPGDG